MSAEIIDPRSVPRFSTEREQVPTPRPYTIRRLPLDHSRFTFTAAEMRANGMSVPPTAKEKNEARLQAAIVRLTQEIKEEREA